MLTREDHNIWRRFSVKHMGRALKADRKDAWTMYQIQRGVACRVCGSLLSVVTFTCNGRH